jgi:hypothetical protein
LNLSLKTDTDTTTSSSNSSNDVNTNVVNSKDHGNNGYEVLEGNELINLFSNDDTKSVKETNTNTIVNNWYDGLEEGDLEKFFDSDPLSGNPLSGNTLRSGLIDITSVSGLTGLSSLSNLPNLKDKILKWLKLSEYEYSKESKEVMVRDIMLEVDKVLDNLNTISSKGCVNSLDLLDRTKHPEISHLISVIIKDKKIIEKLSVKSRIALTYWANQNLLLQLYSTLHNVSLDRQEDDNSLDMPKRKRKPEDDISLDKDNQEKSIYKRLDPVIRQKLQNKGISLIQNIYTGYDTEYQNESYKTNKLLSVQLVVNTKTSLDLPIFRYFRILGINPLTND